MYYVNNELSTDRRYDMSRFLEYETDSLSILSSYFCSELKKIPYSGAIVISQKNDKRPDLISYDIYGNTIYWWIIMLYNDIQTPFDLVAGLSIKYPSLIDLDNLYFKISTKQKAKDLQK